MIADRILLTADRSEDCMADPDCIKLAGLHSQAVDFPKTGSPVSFTELPKPKSKEKPDWYANETNHNKRDFYESTRIIGELFRKIDLPAVPEAQRLARRQRKKLQDSVHNLETEAVMHIYSKNDDAISGPLKNLMNECLDIDAHASEDISVQISELLDVFYVHAAELDHICKNHSLAKFAPLTEEEVVAGTIVAKCSQPVSLVHCSCSVS